MNRRTFRSREEATPAGKDFVQVAGHNRQADLWSVDYGTASKTDLARS
jgi:hypothetical protein